MPDYEQNVDLNNPAQDLSQNWGMNWAMIKGELSHY